MHLRLYACAADLFAAATEGAPNAASMLASVAVLRKARRYEELPDPPDAASFFRKLLPIMFLPETPRERLQQLISPRSPLHNEKSLAAFRAGIAPFIAKIAVSGLSPDFVVDLAAGSVEIVSDHDGRAGYRLRTEFSGPNGAQKLTAYVAREDGRFMLWGLGEVTSLGTYALAAVERGELEIARCWLDWARDEEKPAGGDDPVEGAAFPRYWTKGLQADAATTRFAAALLMATGDHADKAIPILVEGRAKARTDAHSDLFDIALAAAYLKTDRMQELLTVSKRLSERYPDSAAALAASAGALGGLQRWDEARRLIEARLERIKGDPAALRAGATLASLAGDHKASIAYDERLVKIGKAVAGDLNRLAWSHLLAGSVGPEAVETGRRAVFASQSNSFPELHTLAASTPKPGTLLKRGRRCCRA